MAIQYLRFIDTDIYVNNEISMFLRAYLMIFGRMNAFNSRTVLLVWRNVNVKPFYNRMELVMCQIKKIK